MKYLNYLFALVLVVIATGFSMLNAQRIELHYYVGSISISLSLLMIFVLCIGLILGAIILLPTYVRLKYGNLKLRQAVQQYEEEIRNLRIYPIKDDQ